MRIYQHTEGGQLLRHYGVTQSAIAADLDLHPVTVHRAIKGEGTHDIKLFVLASIERLGSRALRRRMEEVML